MIRANRLPSTTLPAKRPRKRTCHAPARSTGLAEGGVTGGDGVPGPNLTIISMYTDLVPPNDLSQPLLDIGRRLETRHLRITDQQVDWPFNNARES